MPAKISSAGLRTAWSRGGAYSLMKMAASRPSGIATPRAIAATSTVPATSAHTPKLWSRKSGAQVVEPKKSPKGTSWKNSTVWKMSTSTIPTVTKAERAAERNSARWMTRPLRVSRPVPPRLGFR